MDGHQLPVRFLPILKRGFDERTSGRGRLPSRLEMEPLRIGARRKRTEAPLVARFSTQGVTVAAGFSLR
jgi:hypothetical protein